MQGLDEDLTVRLRLEAGLQPRLAVAVFDSGDEEKEVTGEEDCLPHGEPHLRRLLSKLW